VAGTDEDEDGTTKLAARVQTMTQPAREDVAGANEDVGAVQILTMLADRRGNFRQLVASVHAVHQCKVINTVPLPSLVWLGCAVWR
jgi:hypothetical protein